MPDADMLYSIMHHTAFGISAVVLLAVFVLLAIRLRVRGGFLLLGYVALTLVVSGGWYVRLMLMRFGVLPWESVAAVASAGVLYVLEMLCPLLLFVFALLVAAPERVARGAPPLPMGGPMMR